MVSDDCGLFIWSRLSRGTPLRFCSIAGHHRRPAHAGHHRGPAHAGHHRGPAHAARGTRAERPLAGHIDLAAFFINQYC